MSCKTSLSLETSAGGAREGGAEYLPVRCGGEGNKSGGAQALPSVSWCPGGRGGHELTFSPVGERTFTGLSATVEVSQGTAGTGTSGPSP